MSTAHRKTVFIEGNQEDFVWLNAQPDSVGLPNLFYLGNGASSISVASSSVAWGAAPALRITSAGARSSGIPCPPDSSA